MKIVICDDEPLARQRLMRLIDELPNYQVVGEASNGQQALEVIERSQADIVLMDIQMPQGSGLEVVRQLQQKPNCPAIIFVTAFDEFALDAFQVQAENYLLKPIRKEQLHNALQQSQRLNAAQKKRALQSLAPLNAQSAQQTAPSKPEEPRFSVHTHRGIELIALSEIRYFRAEQKYVLINTGNSESITEQTLKNLESQLSEDFIRVHRNSLVNLRHISALRLRGGHYYIEITGSTQSLPVSRRHISELKKCLKQQTL